MRFARTLLAGALALVASAEARAVPIGAGAFGGLAVVESFEGLAVGPNLVIGLGASLLEPGVAGPYAFATPVSLTGAIPNPGFDAGGAFVHDFARGADVQNNWGGTRVVNDAADVPFGSAYLGAFAPGAGTVSVAFTFDSLVARVGASVTGVTASTVRLDVYDDANALLESHVLSTVDLPAWGGNFLGVENLAGIRRAVFTGTDFGLDGLTFESAPVVVPEPGTLSAVALGLVGLVGLAVLGRKPEPSRARR